jgi:hypothetical protein
VRKTEKERERERVKRKENVTLICLLHCTTSSNCSNAASLIVPCDGDDVCVFACAFLCLCACAWVWTYVLKIHILVCCELVYVGECTLRVEKEERRQ